ncbi:MAG: trypsin-like peptidase domain-containing protein, partial [Aeromicrobium sp.]
VHSWMESTMKKISMLMVFGLVSLFLSATAAAADDTGGGPTKLEKVSAYVEPSVVYVEMKWTVRIYDTFNKRYLGTKSGDQSFSDTYFCTGYVVNPNGYIATAGHCVDPDQLDYASFKKQGAQWAIDNGYYSDANLTPDDRVGDYAVYGIKADTPDLGVHCSWSVSAGGIKTGKSYAAKVLKFQNFDDGDGALLKIDQTGLQAIKLASSRNLEVGKDIVAVGYPGSVSEVTDADLTPSYKDGSISSKRTISGGLSSVYEVSAATTGGMSGGPVVDVNDSQVLGFTSFGNADETQAFNFARPSSIITELMGGEGVKNTIGKLSVNYKAGLDAFFAKDKDNAVKNLQAVVDEQPSNEFANKYLAKAKKLPDPFPTGLVAGIAVALIVLLGGVGALLMKMRNKGGSGGSSGPTAGMGPMPAAPAAAAMPPTPPIAPEPTPPAEAPASPGSTSTLVMTPDAPEPVPDAVGFQKPTAPPPSPEAITSEQASAAHFCPSCGTKAAEGAKFCLNCGNPI